MMQNDMTVAAYLLIGMAVVAIAAVTAFSVWLYKWDSEDWEL